MLLLLLAFIISTRIALKTGCGRKENAQFVETIAELEDEIYLDYRIVINIDILVLILVPYCEKNLIANLSL